MLAVLDPARRAAGNHGQHASVVEAVDELGAFLHDGQIRTEIGIKYLGKSQTAQGGRHLARDAGAHGQAEFFTQGGAHSGRGLNHHMLGGIGQGLPHILRVVGFGQRAYGAGGDALAAVDAGHFGQLHLPGAFDGGLEAAAHRANHAHLLDICAGAHAAAAQNALVVVADDGDGAGIRFILILGSGEAIAAFHAQIQAQLLQLAVLAAHTAEALLFVVAQNQLQIDAARLAHGRGVGFDHHVGRHRQYAGSLQRAAAAVHHAQAAVGGFVDIL